MKNVDDVLVLTPMQRLMLLHQVARPDDTVLVTPAAWAIDAEVDTAAFRGAWEAVLARHPALRTAVMWEGLDHPVQVVRSTVEFPLREVDLGDFDESGRRSRIDAVWNEETSTPMDLTRAPLLRGTLVRSGEGRGWFLLCAHHLVVDRWSAEVVMADVQRAYATLRAGRDPDLGPARPFRDYVAWLDDRDPEVDERYWREALKGFTTPTLVTRGATPSVGTPARIERGLGADRSARLAELAGEVRLPRGSVFLAVVGWAVGRLTGARDVIVGVTASGRPPELEGVEEIVGSFVNDVPARIRREDDGSLGEWLRSVARAQVARSAHEHVSPAALREWSALPPGEPLWDLLVVLNLDEVVRGGAEQLPLRPVRARLDAAHPLTLGIERRDGEFGLSLVSRIDRATAEGVLDACVAAVDELCAAGVDARLADLAPLVPPPSRALDGVAERSVRAAETAASRPPTDDVETQVVDIWCDVLGLEHVGLDDDFFALGGSSLQAANIFDRIERLTGRSLPLALLAEAATVRGVLTALDRPPARAPGPLVTLRSTGSGTPIYAVSGVGGGILQLLPLARVLPPGRPLRGFQARGFDGDAPPIESIDAIADQYVEAMLDDADGGVHLFGGCWGGAVVHAMAGRLIREGRPPRSVAILEPPLIPTGRAPVPSDSEGGFLGRRARLYWEEFSDLDWAGRRRFLVEKAAVAGRLLRDRGLPEDVRAERGRVRVLAANRVAIERYRPRPVAARARLFFAEAWRPPEWRIDAGDHREDFVALFDPRPEVVSVPGHDLVSALTRHPADFATAFTAWLDTMENP